MKRKTTEEFIWQSKEINGDKYTYDKTVYINAKTKVIITCPIHGDFLQNPNIHISQKCGCRKCSQPNIGITPKEFCNKVNKIFDGRIVCHEEDFKGMDKQITAYCEKHGKFRTYPEHLLKGKACRKCRTEKLTKTTEQFIKEAKEMHGDEYDYSLVNYVNYKTKVKIICPKHGAFEQEPDLHIRGSGCPYCYRRKGEARIRLFLERNDIKYKHEKIFDDLKDKSNLRYDFYLPDYNLLIEFQGQQHYLPIDIFGGEEAFEGIKKRDKMKKDYALLNGYLFLEIKFSDNIEEKLSNYLGSLPDLKACM